MEHNFKVTNDFVFNKIFGTKGNENILKGLVEAVIDRDISFLEIIEDTKLEKLSDTDKLGILDIKARLSDGTKLNIEMQVANEKNIAERTLFYWSKLYCEDVLEGTKYKDIPQTITINILDYNFLPEDKYHMIYHVYDDNKRDTMLTDKLEIHFIDLPKFRKNVKEVGNQLTAWLSFIDGSRKEMLEVATDSVKAIEQAEELLKTLKQDKSAWREYELRFKKTMDDASLRDSGYTDGLEDGMKKGEQEGLKKGLEKGIAKGELTAKKEMAKKLISKGSDLKEISEITGLSISELEKLV